MREMKEEALAVNRLSVGPCDNFLTLFHESRKVVQRQADNQIDACPRNAFLIIIKATYKVVEVDIFVTCFRVRRVARGAKVISWAGLDRVDRVLRPAGDENCDYSVKQ